MLEYLRKLLVGGDTFTVDIFIQGSGVTQRRGVIAVDAVGIVVDEPDVSDGVAFPWTAVRHVTVDISG